jgi:hypothetical protein
VRLKTAIARVTSRASFVEELSALMLSADPEVRVDALRDLDASRIKGVSEPLHAFEARACRRPSHRLDVSRSAEGRNAARLKGPR